MDAKLTQIRPFVPRRAVVCGLAAVVGLPAPLLAGDNETKDFAVNIRGRQVDGMGVVRVKQGDRVRLSWTTDETVTLHLHGYDLMAKAVPGKTAEMTFTARATGRFAVSAHGFESGPWNHGKTQGLLGHLERPVMFLEVHPR